MIATILPFRLITEQLRGPYGPMRLGWRWDVDGEYADSVYLVEWIELKLEWN